MARWSGVDPLAEKYAALSPYNYVLNNPMRYNDPTGAQADDIIIVGTEEYQQEVMTALWSLATGSAEGLELVQNAISSDRDLVIFDSNTKKMDNHVNNFSDNYSTMAFDLGQATADLDPSNGSNGSSLGQSIESSLAHELGHFENGLGYPAGSVLLDADGYGSDVPADEAYAVEKENNVRSDLNMKTRTHYGGVHVAGKEAIQSGPSPQGFKLQLHNRQYVGAANSNAGYQYMFNRVKASAEHRKNYLVAGGERVGRNLKNPAASSQQIRLYD